MVPDLRQFIDHLNLEGFWRSVFHHWGNPSNVLFTFGGRPQMILPESRASHILIVAIESSWVLFSPWLLFALSFLGEADLPDLEPVIFRFSCRRCKLELVFLSAPHLYQSLSHAWNYSSPTHIKPWLMCVSKLMQEMRTVIIYDVFSEFLTDIGNWANLTSAPNSLTHSPSFHHSLLPSLPQ